jgi:hypothetical protein
VAKVPRPIFATAGFIFICADNLSGGVFYYYFGKSAYARGHAICGIVRHFQDDPIARKGAPWSVRAAKPYPGEFLMLRNYGSPLP